MSNKVKRVKCLKCGELLCLMWKKGTAFVQHGEMGFGYDGEILDSSLSKEARKKFDAAADEEEQRLLLSPHSSNDEIVSWLNWGWRRRDWMGDYFEEYYQKHPRPYIVKDGKVKCKVCGAFTILPEDFVMAYAELGEGLEEKSEEKIKRFLEPAEVLRKES